MDTHTPLPDASPKRRTDAAHLIAARERYGSPRARAREKRTLALGWLFLWRASTPGLIRRYLGIQADGYCAALERAGLVTISRTAAVRGSRVVMLSDLGVTLIGGDYPEHIGSYDTRFATVDVRRLVHDLAVQSAVLDAMERSEAAGRPVVGFLPERLCGRADVSGGKRPDALLWLDADELPLAVEVERTPKRPGVELDRALTAAARSIERAEVRAYVYIAVNAPLLTLYRDTLARPLPQWRKDPVSGKWVATGQAWTVPAEIQARFSWRHLAGLLDPFVP